MFTKNITSLPWILFCDGFGIYRNNYRALKAFYFVPANLPYEERRIIANNFTLALGPHGATMKDTIHAFSQSIQELDKGTSLNIGGTATNVCSSILLITGDMPQQADNSGFLQHSACMGCRTCLCPSTERGNLDFDVTTTGRYHQETVAARENAQRMSKTGQKKYLQSLGMRAEVPAMVQLSPTLDLIMSRAYDAPHSEWRGLGRIIQSLLFSSILSKEGAKQYLHAFQRFPYPPGWSKIQSPAYYIWSWSLSEAGKATILIPLILRSCGKPSWYRSQYLKATQIHFANSELNSAVERIIEAYRIIAYCNAIVGNQHYTEPRILQQQVLAARRCFQSLIRCAEKVPPLASSAQGQGTGDTPRNVTSILDESLESEEDVYEDEESANEDNNDEDPMDEGPMDEDDENAEAMPTQQPRGKMSKWQKLLSLPNVHAGLHLAEMAREYSTIMNGSVLSGEVKHKYCHSIPDSIY